MFNNDIVSVVADVFCVWTCSV